VRTQCCPVHSLKEFAEHIITAADRLCGVLAAAAKEGREVEMWRLYGALTMEVRICEPQALLFDAAMNWSLAAAGGRLLMEASVMVQVCS